MTVGGMNIENKKDEIIITIKVNGGGALSKSGKSMVIASTHGNVGIPFKDEVLKLGLNLYRSV